MENYIRLASATEAIRAKKILYSHGINSQVKKISGRYTGGSCSFGIVIPDMHYDKSVDILGNYNIFPIGRAVGDSE